MKGFKRFPPKWLQVWRRKRANHTKPGQFCDSRKSQNAVVLSAAVVAMILAVSPTHAAARGQESETQATTGLNRQSLQTAQTGKSADAVEPAQGKSAEPNSAKAKAFRRAYAIRARIAKQKTQLAKSKQPSLRAKKQFAKSKKQSLKSKKKVAT